MTFSSSPFTSPVRGGNRISASGTGTHRNPISLSDDEDGDDDVVSDSSSSPYFTQPTQITNRPTVGLSNKGRGTGFSRSDAASAHSDASSPAGKIIEVPRSSPFKSSPPQPRRLSGLSFGLAPAGTAYRPPQKVIAKPVGTKPEGSRIQSSEAKRKPSFAESSDELSRNSKFLVRSDSSSSDRPARADIQRTSFQRQALANAPKDSRVIKAAEQAAEFEKFDARTQLKARKLREKLGKRPSLYICARAIMVKKGDMDAAAKSLLSARGAGPSPSPPPSTKTAAKRSSASRSPSPVPAPKRRRLVRGRNPANAAPAVPLITLVDSEDDAASVTGSKDGGGDYESDSESEEEEEEESEDENGGRRRRASPKQAEAEQPRLGVKRASKILEYLWSCTAEQLAADAKISKENAKLFISKRPFHSISQVKAVHHYKTVRKRREKVNLGEDVFFELSHHIKRLSAIDRIVEECDTQGTIIRSRIDSWKMDKLGKIKESDKANTTSGLLPFPAEPKLMKGEMFPYQLYGMNWMWQLYTRGLGAILGDDMGTGKTCQVISFLALLVDTYKSGLLQNKPGPNLIVVPATLVDNWQKEFVKFAPELSVIQYSGHPEVRDELAEEILSSPGKYHIILTSFTTMNRVRDVVWMNKIGINAAIFDEGHTLKNSATKIYRSLIQIKTNWKLLITGTPIQNTIMELITLMSFLSPMLFSRDRDCIEELFSQKASLQEVSEGATLLSDRIQRARSILEPFILSRKKHQVSNLEPATRKVIFCDMTDQQKEEYDKRVTNFRQLKDRKGGGKRKSDENNPWIQLRKAATHPQLFRRFFTDKKCEEMAKILMDKVPHKLDQTDLGRMIEELKGYSDFELHLWCRDFECLRKFDCRERSWFESGKLQKLIELVREYEQNGDRVLVFSPFRKSLGILEECLAESRINYRILVGETSVPDRQKICDEFQADETIPVFLLTTLAGGLGLNLTGANKIIIFDQSGNPQQDIQAENRAHRLGQKRNVEVIRLVSRGTIDELIYKACHTKLILAGEITGHNENMGEVNYTEDMGQADERDIMKSVTEQLLSGEGGGSSVNGGYITPPKSES